MTPLSDAARALQAARKIYAGGRPRQKDRCPCGAMTRKRAKQRNHQCERG